MVLLPVVLLGWFGLIVICYYLIRPIGNTIIRTTFTLIPCILLTYISCRNLPQHDAISIVVIVLCWMIVSRLIHLTILSVDKVMSFQSFFFQILWNLFPVLPLQSKRNEWPIKSYLILIVMKLLVNQWIYRWSMCSETRNSYGRILMLYVCMMTISYLLDAVAILVRILTGDKYTLESFTNIPILSSSLREFWGQRYNRFVSTTFKQTIFEPVRSKSSSSTIGGLTTFAVSGLLHVHVAFTVFNVSSLFPTFMFFFLHGIVCSLEANIKIELPGYVRWFLTQAFLLLTSPIILGPFIEKGSPFLEQHPPPLANIKWIPKLPIPNFCPQ